MSGPPLASTPPHSPTVSLQFTPPHIHKHSLRLCLAHTHLCTVTVPTHTHTHMLYIIPPNPSQDTLSARVCFKSRSPYAIRALLLHSVGHPVFAKCRGKGCQMCTHWNSTPATQHKQAARAAPPAHFHTTPLLSPLDHSIQETGHQGTHGAPACGDTKPCIRSLNYYHSLDATSIARI